MSSALSDPLPEHGPLPTDELFPLVYEEMRRLAAQKIAHERSDCSLTPTALVHEAYIRLSGGGAHWENRRHFFGAAAEAMRRILVENARRRGRQKRGGDLRSVDFQMIEPIDSGPSKNVLELSEALDRLSAEEPDAAELVKLRYFAGLTMKEVADVLEISPRSADRLWAYARAHLYSELHPD